ncbi:MAG: GNAT family N-acetyltransferase [Candidatus Zipacnadales bacterium]
MNILRVTCPDEEFRERILAFLAHKGAEWQVPMRENLRAELEGLRQHFYIGVIGEEIVGNASSIEALDRPVGLLQHVFTPPERRRQGICSQIIHTYVHDFDARGGRAAYLHTDYNSPAYHIYKSAGFVGYLNTGTMERFPDRNFHEDFWAARPVIVRNTKWSDWALLEALFGTVEGWYLRSIAFRQWGRSGYEEEYVRLRKGLEEGQVCEAKVLEAENGAIVGLATISRNQLFKGDTWLLDFFLHPHFVEQGGVLLSALNLELDTKIQCYTESSQPQKDALLKAAGFTLEATFPNQVRKGETWLSVNVYAK